MENYITEFQTYLNGLNEELKANNVSRELYYGFYVFDGPKIPNPDILFVGINPGHGKSDQRFYNVTMNEGKRNSYLDIFEEEPYNYPLASDFVSVLEIAGKTQSQIIELLEHRSTKMNKYAIITNVETDIQKCIQILGIERWKEYHRKSVDFVFDVIRDIKPKVVILEGKGVHDDIIKDWIGFSNVWDANSGVGYLFSDELNTHFISFTRERGKKFDKQVFADRIKDLI